MDDLPTYCRRIETYLCQKNEGHLIRIVGPAFQQVCRWAEHGVPLKIAFRGIDQYCERYYAKRTRRRPVRIEFCEADILDLFDEWRRAVGIAAASPAETAARRKPSLAAHIERVVARLLALRVRDSEAADWSQRVDAAVLELDRLAADAKHARGAAREGIVARLREIDAALIEAASAALNTAEAARMRQEADAELAPFASAMQPAARARAATAAFDRLVREAMALPTVAYE